MRSIACLSFLFLSCYSKTDSNFHENGYIIKPKTDTGFFMRLANAAITLTKDYVVYDPSYTVIPYPGGDVATDKGVCCDVVIRAYRKMGIDLQKMVHEDMESDFAAYPHKWQLTSPDKNIDHRRVPNLMTYFTRRHASLPITTFAGDYKPGDIVCWNLSRDITHIGVVVNLPSQDGERNLIVHNIGGGQVVADCLFSFKVIGHYRYRE